MILNCECVKGICTLKIKVSVVEIDGHNFTIVKQIKSAIINVIIKINIQKHNKAWCSKKIKRSWIIVD